MVSKRIVMRFPHQLVERPIVYDLVMKFGLEFNILRAAVTPNEEGLLVLEIKGTEDACRDGEKYLADLGVSVEPLSQDISRSETKCTHCGACVSVCPSEALAVDRSTMAVVFNDEKCVACEMCIRACPTRAMEVHF